jgi:hypothetical protein
VPVLVGQELGEQLPARAWRSMTDRPRHCGPHLVVGVAGQDLDNPSDWTGLDWTGLDWTGLDWTGLDWTGLDWTGPDRTGPAAPAPSAPSASAARTRQSACPSSSVNGPSSGVSFGRRRTGMRSCFGRQGLAGQREPQVPLRDLEDRGPVDEQVELLDARAGLDPAQPGLGRAQPLGHQLL